jgi:hypothetical protein
MTRITTTIKGVWLRKILDGSKKIEYREVKPYWTQRLSGISIPFELRVINGMSKKAPEATLLIKKVDLDKEDNFYRLHIAKVLSTKNV